MKNSQVNWNHYLNKGLSSFHLVTPGSHGNGIWKDLCRNYDGAITNADPVGCWQGATQQGQWGSLKHNGGTDSVSLAAGGGLNAVQAGTISIWVQWLPGTQETYVVLSGAAIGRSDNVTFTNQSIALNGTNPDTAKITWSPYASNVVACTSTLSPGINVWTHILVTYETGDHRLYINGVLDDTGTTAGTMTTSATTALTFGSSVTSNLIGLMDCYRILPNRIFTEPEVADEYQITARYCAGLLI